MKKLLFFGGIVFILNACKKEPNSTASNFISYFVDTSSSKKTGLDTSSTLELQDFPFVEDVDTSLIPVFGRIMSPPSWNIETPLSGSQGSYNSCVGWSLGYGMLSYQYKIIEGNSDYNGHDKIFSPAFIWNQLNNGSNTGISFGKAFKLLKEQGCCKWSLMPADVGTHTTQPTAAAINNAANYKITEAMKFKTVDIERLKFFLSRNYPIPFGVEIDEGFMTGKDEKSFDKKQDERLVWKQKSGASKGKHAMLICGYDDNIRAFKVLNSWGPNWGNNGFIWIDYDFLNSVIIKYTFLSRPELYLVIPKKFGVVTSPTGRVWMDRNLGASRVATSSDDHLAYGHLYQWGRGSDGHQLINWSGSTIGAPVNGFTTTLSTTNSPGHSLFIDAISAPPLQDWRSPSNDNLWQGLNGINNPCPTGFRLPTWAEFNAEIALFPSQNAVGAFQSVLKLPAAGRRPSGNTVIESGGMGHYWISTVSTAPNFSQAVRLYPTFVSIDNQTQRMTGCCVRCIKD